jgi:hypothetical protein
MRFTIPFIEQKHLGECRHQEYLWYGLARNFHLLSIFPIWKLPATVSASRGDGWEAVLPIVGSMQFDF